MVSVFQVGLGGAQSRRPLPQHLSMERKGQALQVGHWCRGWEGPWLTLVDLSNF